MVSGCFDFISFQFMCKELCFIICITNFVSLQELEENPTMLSAGLLLAGTLMTVTSAASISSNGGEKMIQHS